MSYLVLSIYFLVNGNCKMNSTKQYYVNKIILRIGIQQDFCKCYYHALLLPTFIEIDEHKM